jgi:CTP synthase (UTP-ammonia lyase)
VILFRVTSVITLFLLLATTNDRRPTPAFRMNHVPDTVRIGILGDFNPEFRSHHATNDALQHAAAKLSLKVESQWLATPSLLEPGARKVLESFDGLWASPGSPYKSADGMLKGIEFARTRDWPFLGTCGGFQYTVIECARNVIGMKDADTAENNSGSKNNIIYPVACAVPNHASGAPKLSGVVPEIRIRPGSYLQTFYSEEVIQEEFFCNFELNPDYEWCSIEAGFPIAARGPDGEVRAIESPTHRFFIATLFQPQLSSKPDTPHPLVIAFVQAAADWGRKKLDDSVLE